MIWDYAKPVHPLLRFGDEALIMRQFHLIFTNALIMWMSRVLLLVPQLILVPYLIGTIGEGGYGIYAMVWPLMMSIDQMERSLQSGIVKYSAGFLAQGWIDEVNGVVSSTFIYSILLAVLACTGTLAAAAFYNDPSDRIGSALVVVGFLVLVIVPLTPYIAVIQSRQRYYVNAIAETASKYISLIAVVVWFAVVRPSVEALIVIMSGTLFLSRLVQVPIAYRLVPGLQNRPRLFNRRHFRLIAPFGAATVLISLCLSLNSTGIRWLMDALVSTRFVAHLAIMLMPGLLLSQIVGPMTITAMPAASAYEATGNLRMLQELLVRGMRYTMILVLAGLLVAGPLMKTILHMWVGPDYGFLAPYALALFASGAFMQSTSIAHHILKGLGKLRIVVSIYFVGLAVVPVGLILGLIKVLPDSYLVVTMGLAAGHLVCGCFNIFFCGRAVHAGLMKLFVRAYLQPLIVAATVWLLVIVVLATGECEGPLGGVFIVVLALLLFAIGCYASIATPAERQQLTSFIQTVCNRMTNRNQCE